MNLEQLIEKMLIELFDKIAELIAQDEIVISEAEAAGVPAGIFAAQQYMIHKWRGYARGETTESALRYQVDILHAALHEVGKTMFGEPRALRDDVPEFIYTAHVKIPNRVLAKKLTAVAEIINTALAETE